LKATGSGRTTRRRAVFGGRAAGALLMAAPSGGSGTGRTAGFAFLWYEAVRARVSSSSRCALGSTAVGKDRRSDMVAVRRRRQHATGHSEDPAAAGSPWGLRPCQQQGPRPNVGETRSPRPIVGPRGAVRVAGAVGGGVDCGGWLLEAIAESGNQARRDAGWCCQWKGGM